MTGKFIRVNYVDSFDEDESTIKYLSDTMPSGEVHAAIASEYVVKADPEAWSKRRKFPYYFEFDPDPLNEREFVSEVMQLINERFCDGHCLVAVELDYDVVDAGEIEGKPRTLDDVVESELENADANLGTGDD